jgi:hypothetical protein
VTHEVHGYGREPDIFEHVWDSSISIEARVALLDLEIGDVQGCNRCASEIWTSFQNNDRQEKWDSLETKT